MKTAFKISMLFLILIICSCVKNSEYKNDDLHKAFYEKNTWNAISDSADSSKYRDISPSHIIQPEWWKKFNDPYLNQLVETAVSGNIDLKIAVKRIQDSESNIKVSKYIPYTNLSVNSSFSQRREEIPEYSFTSDNTKFFQRPKEEVTSGSQYFNLGLNINWEIDLWGKKKKGHLANQAGYRETKAQYRAEYLKLVSEIAQTYFQIYQKDREIRLTKKLYEHHQKKLAIYEKQYSEGIADSLKIFRQKEEMKNSEKELSESEQMRKRLENKIAVLIGKIPGEFKIPDTSSNQEFQIIKIPVGLPSDLLSRRPDIIAAEYRVLKAHHRLGEARAAKLPSISLTGNGGFASSTLSSLIRQWTGGITPNISFPLLDGTPNQAEVNENQLKIAEDEYRKTVMTAFEEVENTLGNLSNKLKQKTLLENSLKNIRKIQEQAAVKFEMGLVSCLDVSDIEREVMTSEKLLLSMNQEISDNTVNLFKALGGGWIHEEIKEFQDYLAFSEDQTKFCKINLKKLVVK